jgi:hypothetical protein
MRQTATIFILILLITISCSSPTDNRKSIIKTADSLTTKIAYNKNEDSLQMNQLIKEYDLNRIDTFLIGDLDNDGKKDKAIIQPLIFYFRNDKIDSQFVNITFTCKIPSIKHYNGFQGLIANVGDLDGNKTDELVYYPDWYQSNSAGIYIYGYRQNKWTMLGSGSIRRDIVDEQIDPLKFLKSRINKVDNYSFNLTQHIWTEEGKFVDSTIRVNIK